MSSKQSTALQVLAPPQQSLVSYEIKETPSGHYAAVITQKRDSKGKLDVPLSNFETVYEAIGVFFHYEEFLVTMLRQFSQTFSMSVQNKAYRATFALAGQGKEQIAPTQKAFTLTGNNICIPKEARWPNQGRGLVMPDSITPPSLHIDAFQTTIQPVAPHIPQDPKGLESLAKGLTAQWNIG